MLILLDGAKEFFDTELGFLNPYDFKLCEHSGKHFVYRCETDKQLHYGGEIVAVFTAYDKYEEDWDEHICYDGDWDINPVYSTEECFDEYGIFDTEESAKLYINEKW